MASWIGATPQQRFKQYILPDAQKRLASDFYERERARIAALVRKFRKDHAEATTELQRKKSNRRIRAQLDEWSRVCEQRQRDLATAEAA